MSDAAISHTLLGLFAVAFMAWAGFLWRVTDGVRSVLSVIDSKLNNIIEHINRVDADLQHHVDSPGHHNMLQMHASTIERIDNLRRDVDELRRR